MVATALVLAWVSAGAVAETTISAGWAATAMFRQDQTYSEAIGSDVAFLDLRLGLDIRRTRDVFLVDLAAAFLDMRTHEPFTYLADGEERSVVDSPYTLVGLSGGYLRRLRDGPFAVGGLVSADIESIVFVFGEAGVGGYLAYIALEPVLLMDVPLGGAHHLAMRVQTPLAGWFTRSPFAIHSDVYIQAIADHTFISTFLGLGSGAVTTITTVQRLRLQSEYSYLFTPRLQGRITYRGEALHIGGIRELISYRHSLSLGVGYAL